MFIRVLRIAQLPVPFSIIPSMLLTHLSPEAGTIVLSEAAVPRDSVLPHYYN
jgi:hypothetical protein